MKDELIKQEPIKNPTEKKEIVLDEDVQKSLYDFIVIVIERDMHMFLDILSPCERITSEILLKKLTEFCRSKKNKTSEIVLSKIVKTIKVSDSQEIYM